ncbi:MAG TPA: hypothetical protein VED63_01325 [Acidimicrobiales bacterium]|nr:hypothetical protein [Acidimicrobiales bacterium]
MTTGAGRPSGLSRVWSILRRYVVVVVVAVVVIVVLNLLPALDKGHGAGIGPTPSVPGPPPGPPPAANRAA